MQGTPVAGADRPFNILIDDLPETITVNGRSFPIVTDFRTMILFELMLADQTMSDEEKTLNFVEMIFPDTFPQDIEKAAKEVQRFYACGNLEQDKPKRRRRANNNPDEQAPPPPQPPRIYDFQVDAPLIYAAFLTQYGIDLNEIEYLHWWKFMALFQGLHEDHLIVKIIGYRSMDLSKIKDKDTRSHYANLKRKYALPTLLTNEQKIAAAGNAFAGGRR